MINQELSRIFERMGDYLEMEEDTFRANAYRKVAEFLATLDKNIDEIEDLESLPSIGKGIAEKIKEYTETGKIKDYEELVKKAPIKLNELTSVEGVGVKRVKILYDKLEIKNLKDLEKAAKQGKIAELDGFGEKTEKNILEGIEFLKKEKGRFLLIEADQIVIPILKELEKLKEVERISTAGSYRRKKETIGDIDILISSKNPQKIVDFFVSRPEVAKVWGKGETKSSVRTREGIDIDLRIVSPESFGSALQYFTGSKDHNIATRKIAISKGCKLSEYGLFRKNKQIAGKNEKEVYNKIGLDWIAPEMRENTGEIELAKNRKLPKLVELKDIKGDLHCHSSWNGGEHTIEEMARRAQEMGYSYIGISDHTQFLRIENGLNEKQLLAQKKEIDKLNSKFKIQNLKFKILWGCEANILNNGSIDISDKVLSQMDYVIAGVHSKLKMNREEMTERIIGAMKNPNVNIISHPSGRILKQRDECVFDFEKILKTARENNVILEINSSPDRLDLKDSNIRKAIRAGVKMIINTDAHSLFGLDLMRFGASQARRGWAEKKDIINTQSLDKLLKYFN